MMIARGMTAMSSCTAPAGMANQGGASRTSARPATGSLNPNGTVSATGTVSASGSGGDEDGVGREAEQQAEQDPAGGDLLQARPARDGEQLDDHVEDGSGGE